MTHPDYLRAFSGYIITILFIADFIALIFVRGLIITPFLGVGFIIGAIRFFFGSKGIKSMEFSANPFKFKLNYYNTHKKLRKQ
ncbi:MAG: hypothetical protein M1580_01135 [Candidatus Parvarchaeota archaeon]|nr:hypothetical protein [Candidatus Parvarchaeota archaeon]